MITVYPSSSVPRVFQLPNLFNPCLLSLSVKNKCSVLFQLRSLFSCCLQDKNVSEKKFLDMMK